MKVLASIAIGLATLLPFASYAQTAFKPPVPLSNNWYTRGAFAADFDNDGKVDLASYTTGAAAILYTNGPQDFTHTVVHVDNGTSNQVDAFDVADINEDGMADFVAFVNGPDYHMSLFLSTGRAFTEQKLNIGTARVYTNCLRIADLDKDGKKDIVYDDAVTNSLNFLKGDGTGNFVVHQLTDIESLRQFVIADFNADGVNDIAGTQYPNELEIYVGGAGNSFARTAYTLGGASNSIVAADFSGDNIADIALTFYNQPVNQFQTIMYTNNGNAGFVASSPLPTAANRSLVAIDYNGDGRNDLLAAGMESDQIPALRNDGGGVFTAVDIIENPARDAFMLTTADFNDDGDSELIVAPMGSGIYVKDFVAGQFVDIEDEVFDINAARVLTADMNQDGFKDFVTCNHFTQSIIILYGDANGSYTDTKLFSVPSELSDCAIADFNSDTYPDIAFAGYDYGVAAASGIIFSNSTGGYEAPEVLSTSGYLTAHAVDFNVDGKIDIVFDNKVFLSDGAGAFTSPDPIPVPILPGQEVIADFDGDGFPDIAINNHYELKLAYNDGSGQFPIFNDLLNEEVYVPMMDAMFINQDQLLDFIVISDVQEVQNLRKTKIMINAGNREFTTTELIGPFGRYVVAADFDEDGLNDLVTTHQEKTYVYLQKATGGFDAPFEIPVATAYFVWKVGQDDMNEDGRIDIYTYTLDGELDLILNDFVSEPTVQPSALAIENLTDVSVRFNLQKGDGTGQLLVLRKAPAVNNNLPSDGVFYAANSSFSVGATVGSGNYVVMRSDETSVDITGLEVGTEYQLLAFEYASNTGNTIINYKTTTPASLTFTTKKHQTISFEELLNATFSANPITVHASATSGLPVALAMVSGTATISGDQLTALAPGPMAIKGTQSGNDEYMPAPEKEFNFFVYPSQPTALAVEDRTDVSVTVTLTGGNGTGRLVLLRSNPSSNELPLDGIFYEANANFPEGALIGEGNHVVLRGDATSVDITGLAEGTEYQVLAFEYLTNQDNSQIKFSITGPAVLTFTTKKNQVITFAELPTQTFSANAITINASATSELPVAFAVVAGGAAISGNQLTASAPGPIVIKGTQAGNDEYMPAPEKEFTFFLYPSQPTALAVENRTDVSVTVTLAGGNGTGRLVLLRSNTSSNNLPLDGTFYEANTNFPQGALIGEGNHVVMRSDATSVDITGLEEGTEYQIMAFEYLTIHDNSQIKYSITGPAVLTFTTKKNQAITFAELPAQTFSANAITINASATSDLPVALSVFSGNATLSDTQLTASAPGPMVIKGTQPGDDEYMPAPVKEFSFFIYPIQPTSLAIEDLNDESVTVTLVKGNGTGRLLLIRSSTSSDAGPVDGVFYEANSLIGEGNRVVMSSSATSVNITDLEGGTEYEVLAFEYWTNENNTDIRYTLADRPALTFTTIKNQTIAFVGLLDETFGQNAITINAFATSGLPVALAIVSGAATLDGNQLTATSPGPILVIGSQAGNDEYMPAPDKEFSFCVYPSVPTITVDLGNDPSPKLTSSAAANNQWLLNGEAVNGATGQEFLPAVDGVYTVKVDYSGCARTSAATGHVIAGTIEEESVHVFPNPVANRLMITLPGKSRITGLSMTDMQGRTASPVVALRGNSAEVDVQGLAEGMYVVRVAYDGGEYQQKVLKVR